LLQDATLVGKDQKGDDKEDDKKAKDKERHQKLLLIQKY